MDSDCEDNSDSGNPETRLNGGFHKVSTIVVQKND